MEHPKNGNGYKPKKVIVDSVALRLQFSQFLFSILIPIFFSSYEKENEPVKVD